MARVIDDHGHIGRATKPLALRTYEPGALPDPAQCVDSLILVNDRADGIPRKRLHLSNGASWDALAFVLDVPRGVVGAAAAVDLTPIIRQAVVDTLPALMPPPMRVVSPPVAVPASLPSESVGQVLDIVSALTERVAELEERLSFAERHAATTDIEVRAT